MGISKQVRAGAAFVELKTKDNGLTRGLRKAERQLKAFGASATRVGARLAAGGGSVVAGAALATRVFANYGDQLDKISKRTGFTVETLSALGFAAEQSGASIEQLEKGIQGMQRALYDASRGLATQVETLKRLGLTYEEIKNLSPEEQFALLADRLSKVSDMSERAGIAMQIFGRAGRQLLPMFENGAEGINQFVKEARDLGLIVDAEAATAAAELTDRLNILRRIVRKVTFDIGSALAPAAIAFAKNAATVLVSVGSWIRENKSLVLTIVAVSGAVVGAGVALVSLGIAVKVVAFALGGIATLFGLVGAAAGIAGSAIAFLISPIGLVTAAILGLGALIVVVATDVEGAVANLKTSFMNLADSTGRVLGAIRDALLAGDLELGMKIVAKSLELVWSKMLGSMRTKWSDFTTWILKQFGLLQIGLGFTDAGLDTIAGAAGNNRSTTESIAKEIEELKEELERLLNTPPEPSAASQAYKRFEDFFKGFGNLGGNNTTTTRGTFNGFGLSSLGTVVDRSIEENTRRTAEAAEEVALNTRDGGLRFT